jgi:hypothetical protein
MYISQENFDQTEKRLKRVIREAKLKFYEENYCFEEFPIENYEFNVNALAVVRDEEIVSHLIATDDNTKELFRVFRFHFKDGLDNSGFVGWLASKIKQATGSGVFVVCGQNSNDGGIFDYWGCPLEIADEVIGLIRNLRN